MLGAVWIVEATEWGSMLFERPEIINKVDEVLKEYSVKSLDFLVNIQTLPVATQSVPLQPLPKHPIFFFTLKKILSLLNFVYRLIVISTSSKFLFIPFGFL